MDPRKEDRIENLKKKLYSPSGNSIINKNVTPLQEKSVNVDHSWKLEDNTDPDSSVLFGDANMLEKPKKPVLSWVFLSLALLFFAGSSVFAWYYINNQVSVTKNVALYFTGPVSVKGGTEVSFDISIQNQNQFPLELVDVVIEYPSGTKNPLSPSEDLTTVRESLGDIAPGEVLEKTITAILYGSEKEKKSIIAKVEYQIPNSNAVYDNEKFVDVLIETAPFEFVLDLKREVIIGQEAELDLAIRSNSVSDIGNVLIKAEYPSGFSFVKSTPAPESGNNTWLIDNLRPESEQRISIVGTFNGQSSDARFFRFEGGVRDKIDPDKIGSIFATLQDKVLLTEPFISLGLEVEGEQTEGDAVAQSGSALGTKIGWQNNLDTSITDVILEVVLRGNALDQKTVNTYSGFYRSSEDKIVWNDKTNKDFQKINPGDSGQVNLSFSTLRFDPQKPIEKNQYIEMDISISAKRPSESNVPEDVKSTIVKKIKIQSDVDLAGRSVYYVGPFVNTGPLPPEPEKHTTYTVIWTIANTTNDLSDVTVEGTLPPYVSWNNQFSPNTERVVYDEKTGKIKWTVGNVSSGVGYSRPARELAFQLDLFPSVNQAGETPILMSRQMLSATDSYTGTTINRELDESITTRISTDPNYTTSIDRVTE